MRSKLSYEEGPARVEKIILESRERGGVNFETIINALHSISDNPYSEKAAYTLAGMLGPLLVVELRYLLREASNSLVRESQSVMDDAEERLNRLVEGAQLGASTSISPTISQIRSETDIYRRNCIIPLAATLQALVWATSTPDKSEPIISY